MMHGQDVLVVLCSPSTAAAQTHVLLLGTQGETLHRLDGMSGWLAHDVLGIGHPQLVAMRTGFGTVAASKPNAQPALAGYAVLGPLDIWSDVPDEGAAAAGDPPAEAKYTK